MAGISFCILFPSQEVIIDGYKIPAGHYVGFLTRAANCDPKIFPEAEKFLPERWDTWWVPIQSMKGNFDPMPTPVSTPVLTLDIVSNGLWKALIYFSAILFIRFHFVIVSRWLIFVFCFHSNQLDRERVWTFGSGPRMCIGHKFIHKIIKVCFHAMLESLINRDGDGNEKFTQKLHFLKTTSLLSQLVQFV